MGPWSGLGCRCSGPRSDQHSCGEENLSSLSLERVVHVQLGVWTTSKVPGGLHAHSASQMSPTELLLIGLVEMPCWSGVPSKGLVGFFARQFLNGLGVAPSLRAAGIFCFLLGNGSTFNSVGGE